MTGCFGFELNPAILSDEEKAQLRAQIKLYKAHEKLMTQGLYSRLTTCDDKSDLVSWQFTSHDKSEALVNVVAKATHGNAPFTVLLLAELDESASYIDEESRIYKGAALCRGGILIPQLKGDYPAFSMYFKKVEGEL
jgi:alpha-galactosidase